MIAPWQGVGIVLMILVALLALLRETSRHDPEVARKMVHVGMGLSTLAFPWLFDTIWPVVFLASAAAVFFLALRMHARLRRALGGSLHSVARATYGEFHFVAGTCIVFVLAGGDALPFCIAMLILTFADTAAALAGRRYAHPRGSGDKSIPGSTAFLFVAFACAYLSLAVFTGARDTQCLALAALVAAVTTVLEAIARRGLDNLLVPVGAYVALAHAGLDADLPAGPQPAGAMAAISAAGLAVVLLASCARRRRADGAWAAK